VEIFAGALDHLKSLAATRPAVLWLLMALLVLSVGGWLASVTLS
jgi:hypothetical protein